MRPELILITFAKAIRSFAFTALSVSVPFFLISLKVSTIDISLVVLVSMAVSTGFLYVFTSLRLHPRHKLILLSTLFFVALLVLYIREDLIALIAAIFIGSISLGGRDLTVNQSLEQFTISTYSENQKEKNLMFGLYNFGSYAAGAIASGFLFLISSEDFPLIFLVILILSSLQIAIYLYVSFPDVVKKRQVETLSDRALRKNISNLAVLFSVDSIGGGLVNTAIISLWFRVVYNISLSQAGLIFVLVNAITALSVLLSSHISGRIGLVKTMVYTHLISNIFLFAVPVFHNLLISEIFLYLRQSTSQMDVPARDSFINSFVPRDARVVANSTFLAVRNGGQVPGPGIAGIILSSFPEGVFFTASLTKIAYDLAFFFGYRKYSI
ncbi:MAG: MFS transporter [Thermoplasmataceae archaeon]